MKVAVVGGGISGLASAHFLAEAGADVTLYEASDRFGGVAAQFDHEGTPLDRFYHVLLPSDDHLLALIRDLGLSDRVYWRETSLGFVFERKLFSLGSALDLLRFSPVPLVDRVRLGLTALWATYVARPDPLDKITVAEWLTRLSGRRAFESLWKPLLQAKFGAAYSQIPAMWYWASFNREKGTGKEFKGYLGGGYRAITERLVGSLEDRGVTLRAGQPISRVDLDSEQRVVVSTGQGTEVFDRLVMCTPLAVARQLADGSRIATALDECGSDLDYQGALNVVVLLRRPVTPHYWLAVVNSDVPFQGMVETTCVIDREDSGSHHLVYLLNYVHRSDPLFSRSDESVRTEYIDAFHALFPEVTEDDVEAAYVFRTPFVEPIWTTGYSDRRPPLELIPRSVFLATTAHVYPRVTSWNSSIDIARQAVDRLLAGSGDTGQVG